MTSTALPVDRLLWQRIVHTANGPRYEVAGTRRRKPVMVQIDAATSDRLRAEGLRTIERLAA